MPEIQLGDVAKDNISGFKGVVIAVTSWLHGCRRLTLSPQGLKDGKLVGNETFDEGQLTLVKRMKPPAPVRTNGGPRPEPTRATDPR